MNGSSSPPSWLALLEDPVLRTVGSGPYTGQIIGLDDGPVVRVPAADPVADLHWDAAGEHVVVARDLQLRPDGVAVLLPHCVTRVLDVVDQRRADPDPLRLGEAVTLAVSILRGSAAEHLAHGDACRGRWWLADDGTPLFAHEAVGTDAAAAGAEVLRACASAFASDTRAAAAYEEAAAAVADPERLAGAIAQVEGRLFALAPPEPVRMIPRGRRVSPAGSAMVADPPGERTAWRRLADAADAGVAEMVSSLATDAWRALRRRPGTPRPSRRGRVLLAAAAGTLVLAVGLLWPTEQGQSAGRVPSAPGAAVPGAPPDPDPEGEGAAAMPDEGPSVTADGGETAGVAATTALLEALRAGGDDAACRHALQDRPDDMPTHGAAFAATEVRTLTLLDDVGGLVLVRAEDTTGVRAPQIVAVLRTDEKWVLRDIHDVAQHPG